MTISKSKKENIWCFDNKIGRIVSLLIAGAITSLAFPSHNHTFVLFLTLPVLLLAIESSKDLKQAFWAGWYFGFGHFITSLYWIANSLLVEPEKFAWLIPFAVSLLPAALAIYIGLVSLVTYRVTRSGWQKVLIFGSIWTMFEILRGYLFTGFPWNLLGYVWEGNLAVLQVTSIIGIYGLSLVTVIIATMPVLLLQKFEVRTKVFPIGIMILLLVSIWMWGDSRLNNYKTEYTEKNIHLVQANIQQHFKWEDEKRFSNFFKNIILSEQAVKGKESEENYIVWSETSVPFVLEREPELLEIINKYIPDDSFIFTGALRMSREEGGIQVWNSLYTVGGDGKILGKYDKSKLVPFGEFIPLRSLLPSFVKKITHGGIDFSSGNGSKTMELNEILPFSPLICYEVIFPDYVVGDVQQRPDWLLNITNDAWFGVSSGPYQHLAMARVRAIEYGIPLARVANTGVTTMFDSFGRNSDMVELNKEGVISKKLPKITDSTIYGEYKSLIVMMMIFACLIIGYWRK